MHTRREFLAAGLAGAACSGPGSESPAGQASLIGAVERSVIWDGRRAGFTWFHPRPCRLPDGRLLMAVQNISGSDLFGAVHRSESIDAGRSWSEPVAIPGLERIALNDRLEEAIADTVPQHHPPTDSVLFLGWNVYYGDNRLTQPNEKRWPVYVVRRADGNWTARTKLEWDHPEAARIYGSNCSQRLTLEDGKILIPMTYASYEREDRVVGTVLCGFDGEKLRVERTGNFLELAVKRGLLEPSITRSGGAYYMTIRAEDGRGYWSRSGDGLEWEPMQAWRFDDGEELVMSTTQQHWLEHSEGLHLVYTRKRNDNTEVMRWRAPLLAARFDAEAGVLIRETETVLLPLDTPGKEAARLGNFHVVQATEQESLVTAGEARPEQEWRGDTLQARIVWRSPNLL